jgi:hypothetical protein
VAIERQGVMTQSGGGNRPPRWAERLLQFLVKPRDRDTIAGDLLEEYREVVLPARGRPWADLWYVKQALSLINGLTLGIVLGAAFGVWNLVYTALAPLAEDTPLALASFYGSMFVIWGLAGFAAHRRSGRLMQAIKVGAVVAFATFVVFEISIFIRINLFLDAISQREDWQGLLARYKTSGFDSLRAYANYDYAMTAPLKMLTALTMGAVTGLIGGLVGITDVHVRRIRKA